VKVLLYCQYPHHKKGANTTVDHIDSFKNYSNYEVVRWSKLNSLPSEEFLSKFDCLVIHHSISLIFEWYASKETLLKIRNFKGIKALFIQDEYRRINFVCAKINFIGIDILFTCAPSNIARKIYSDLNSRVKIETVLTGYIPENLINVDTPNLSDRRIDIGYRARKCPFWYGYKSAEKFLIGEHFIHYSKGTRLLNDISWREKDRLYGQDWIKFISNCKATLGTESGASIIDFTGTIEYNLNRFQAFHPLAKFEDVPPVLLQNDGKLQIQVISPRCFEAAALKTVMVLYPGTYSDILIKDKHYIELKKDFSNFNQVHEKLKDIDFLNKISFQAKKDLVDSGKYTYAKFIEKFDDLIEQTQKEKKYEIKSYSLNDKELKEIKNIETNSLKIGQLKKFTSKLRNIWKFLPGWLNFILSVTVLRRKYYCHFDKTKYSYLNS
jgi:hypothetical protein